MKRLLNLTIWLVFLAFSVNAQIALRNYTGTASQDTIKKIGTVAATTDSAKIKYILGINFNSCTKLDTVSIWQTSTTGTAYIGIWAWDSITHPPFNVPINLGLDSAYVIIKRVSTSNVSVIFKY